MCYELRDILCCEKLPLSFTNQNKHKIKLIDKIPIYSKSYRFPEVHKTEVVEQMKKMLDQNIIQPSNSSWSCPVWIVPKKKKFRDCPNEHSSSYIISEVMTPIDNNRIFIKVQPMHKWRFENSCNKYNNNSACIRRD